MKRTTLCYIQQDGKYLLMRRDKKEHDVNEGKYVGVGGKFLPGESPDQCLLREVLEETGFKLTEFSFRGLVKFVSDTWEDEDMYLYSGTAFQVVHRQGLTYDSCGLPVPQCDEGTFQWVPIHQVSQVPTWEGDRYFLDAMAAGETDIRMTLRYEGDNLVEVCRNRCPERGGSAVGEWVQ